MREIELSPTMLTRFRAELPSEHGFAAGKGRRWLYHLGDWVEGSKTDSEVGPLRSLEHLLGLIRGLQEDHWCTVYDDFDGSCYTQTALDAGRYVTECAVPTRSRFTRRERVLNYQYAMNGQHLDLTTAFTVMATFLYRDGTIPSVPGLRAKTKYF